MAAVKLDEAGRIPLPADVLARHGWRPGTPVDIAEVPDGVVIRRKPKRRRKRYAELTPAERVEAFDQWLGEFGGTLKGRTTTDEAMRLTRGDD